MLKHFVVGKLEVRVKRKELKESDQMLVTVGPDASDQFIAGAFARANKDQTLASPDTNEWTHLVAVFPLWNSLYRDWTLTRVMD